MDDDASIDTSTKLASVLSDHEDGTRPLIPPKPKHFTRPASSGNPRGAGGGETKRESKILSVCSFILVTEFCERLAYYGMSASLIAFFVKDLNYEKVFASELNTLFTTLCYISPLAGAYISDKFMGRYKTILSFSVIYAIGLVLCMLGSIPPYSEVFFLIGLLLFLTLGSGGIKPNVVVFGADQFDDSIEEEVKEKARFFNYFYWAINLGATFSYGYLTHIALNGQDPIVSVKWGFFASFAIPTAFFVVGIMIFVAGAPRYKHVPPSNSVLGEFATIVWTAGRKTIDGRAVLLGLAGIVLGMVTTTSSYFVHTNPLHTILAVSGMTLIFAGIVLVCYFGRRTRWLNAAADLPTVTCKVPDAAEVMRLTPYLGLLTVFWAVYGQMSNNFFSQGCQMDLRLGDGEDPPLLSANLLNLFDTFVILLFVPLFDAYLYPAYERWTGSPLKNLRKIEIGFLFCVISMIVAGFVEIERKKYASVESIGSNCDDVYVPMSKLTIWAQVPQYVLVGIAEILVSISSYELFYSEVPSNMRSVCQALNLLTTSLGSMVTGGINSIFASWLPDNLDDGKLENVYFFIAGLSAVGFVALRWVSATFVYKAEVDGPLDEESLIASGFSPPLGRASVSRSHFLRRDSSSNYRRRRLSVPAIPVSPPRNTEQTSRSKSSSLHAGFDGTRQRTYSH